MQKAIGRILAPGWRDRIADLGFGIWDFKRRNTGFGRGGVGSFATGVLQNRNFATRGAKLGFCIIGPPGGGTALQKRNGESGKRTRKHGKRARGCYELCNTRGLNRGSFCARKRKNGRFGDKKQQGKTPKWLGRTDLQIIAARIMQKGVRRVCKKNGESCESRNFPSSQPQPFIASILRRLRAEFVSLGYARWVTVHRLVL